MASRNLTITIPEELAQKAQILANIRNGKSSGKWSRNYIIRLAIEDYLNKYAEELAKGGKKVAERR
jgi:metal-responsive CopG/Arc/MetJ family transcriptional regulator